MSAKWPLIGLVSTLIGLILLLLEFVVETSSSDRTVDALGDDVDDSMDMVGGFVLVAFLLIVYIPIVFIEMGWCGCLGAVKDTALRAIFEAKGKIIKIILIILSLLVFALGLVFLIYGQIGVEGFNNVASGVMAIVAVIFWLINLVVSVLYIRT